MKKLMSLKEFDEERQIFFSNAIDISLILIAFLLVMGIVWLVVWSIGG